MNALWITGEVQPGRMSIVITAPVARRSMVKGTPVHGACCGRGTMLWSQWVPDRCLRGVYAAIFDNSRWLP